MHMYIKHVCTCMYNITLHTEAAKIKGFFINEVANIKVDINTAYLLLCIFTSQMRPLDLYRSRSSVERAIYFTRGHATKSDACYLVFHSKLSVYFN